MEIVVEETSLKALHRRASEVTHDTIGATEWPTFQAIATAKENELYEAAASGSPEQTAFLKCWSGPMRVLCDLREEPDFPREWFYRAWYRLQIVIQQIEAGQGKIMPEIADEANPFLDADTRAELEHIVKDHLASGAPITDPGRSEPPETQASVSDTAPR